MNKTIEHQKQEANASVGYGPNNPEPMSLRESEIPKDKDKNSLHAAEEYINSTPSANKTEP